MQKMFDACKEFVDRISEWIVNTANAVIDTLISDEFAEILQAIIAALDTEKRKAERAKWRITTPNKPNALMLDRRMSIHRCRNAI